MRTLALLSAAALLLLSCQAGSKPADAATAAPGAPTKADASYDFGVLVATNLKSTGVSLDYESFVNGMKDVLEKNAPKVTLEKANQDVQVVIADAQKTLGEANAAKETQYLADNGKKAGVKTTASGLEYEVITEGTGAKPKATDTVKVDYVGKLLDGTTFDSSIDRKQPAVFPLGQVIPGWTEGIQLMGVGSKYKLTIPSKLAYGPNAAGGGRIPANSTLVFEVTLLSIEPPAPAPKVPAKN